ncbi:MAG: hypothetical protein IPG45_17480 [Deltaproteobacteria bacterium]|nr:hypothetical protein [Deltaproteobacteria bacterium]
MLAPKQVRPLRPRPTPRTSPKVPVATPTPAPALRPSTGPAPGAPAPLAKLALVSQAAVTFTAAPVQLDLATLLNDQGALASCGSIRSTPTPQAATSSQLRSDDLLALCQLARQYLDSGAAALALQIFQGLAAHAPQNPSVQLGLGLAADHLGDRELAERAYTRARALDPACPRAELNLAELRLEAGDRPGAVPMLRAALAKAERRRDVDAADKARALLSLTAPQRSAR